MEFFSEHAAKGHYIEIGLRIRLKLWPLPDGAPA